MFEENRRKRTREALMRHADVDQIRSGREQIGAQIGLLCMLLSIAMVGVLPLEEWLRVPFLTVAFVASFVIGHGAKRALDEWWDR